MREVHGDDAALAWLSALADNDPQVYANNSAIVQAVSRGEVDMGLVNHYYNLRALAEDPALPSLNHFFDDVGSLVIITGAGILGSSPRSDEATQLVQFLLGEAAQKFFTDETFEYPLATSGRPAAGLPSLEEIQATTYDFDDIGGGLDATQELINVSGLAAP
jgi:iron(III) transport system substrate-binding protein